MSKQFNYDEETTEQLTKAQALEAMLRSSGWQVAEADLLEMITQLRDIRNIPSDGDIAEEIKVNKKVAESLEDWLSLLKSQVNNGIMSLDKNQSSLIERR